MFRKLTSTLIALVMLMACCAMAEGITLTPVYTDIYNFSQTEDDLHIIVTSPNGFKSIITNAGETCTQASYTFLEELDYGFYAASTAIEGVDITGIIDVNGNQIAPNQYISVNAISPRWGIGAYSMPATEDSYLFQIRNSEGGYNYYGVSSVDVIDLTTGTVVGNLPYDQCYGGQAYYDHLLLQDVDGNVTLYDSTLTPIDYEVSSVYASLYEGKDGNIVFKPTGAIVMPGYDSAALEEAAGQDVLVVRKYDADYNSTQGIVDMAGNLLTPMGTQTYIPLYRESTVVKTYEGDFYGLYDIAAGAQLVPNVYDDIETTYTSVNKFVNNGYICVEKDDMLGFVDVNGNVTCEIKHPVDNSDLYGCVIVYENEDGTTTLVAADGVVTTIPYEVSGSRSGGNGLLLAVEDENDMGGIIDWHGNIMLPLTNEWGVTITGDSSAVIVHGANGNYELNRIDWN